MKENLSIIGQLIIGYLMLDFVFFFIWVESGQVAEGLYLGKITAEILKAII
jgi:hypothetical protein